MLTWPQVTQMDFLESMRTQNTIDKQHGALIDVGKNAQNYSVINWCGNLFLKSIIRGCVYMHTSYCLY